MKRFHFIFVSMLVLSGLGLAGGTAQAAEKKQVPVTEETAAVALESIPADTEQAEALPENYQSLQALKTAGQNDALTGAGAVPKVDVPETPEEIWDEDKIIRTTQDVQQFQTDPVVTGDNAAKVTSISKQIKEIRKIQQGTY
jgi:hypothetical protein